MKKLKTYQNFKKFKNKWNLNKIIVLSNSMKNNKLN